MRESSARYVALAVLFDVQWKDQTFVQNEASKEEAYGSMGERFDTRSTQRGYKVVLLLSHAMLNKKRVKL